MQRNANDAVIARFLFTVINFLINAGFNFRLKDIWKLSVYYSFMKVKITFGNIGIVIILLFLSSLVSDFLIVFAASIVCYLFMLNSKAVVEDIKTNFCESQENY